MKITGFRKMSLLLTTTGALLLAVACQKNISSQHEMSGTLSSVKIYLTDDPSLVFDKVLLEIQQLEIKVEDDSQEKHEREHQNDVDDNDHHGDQSGGWRPLAIHAGVYDILRFRNGLDTLFATDSFPAVHKLKKLRITLGKNNSVVYNDVSFPLSQKSNDNYIVMKMEASAVNINAGGLSSIWIDIDAGRSIKKNGNQFELKPSVKLFSKELTGGAEGRVLPKDAAAVVMAINGTDTASAKPELEGEFKFKGLKAGSYRFLYHATAGNYRDTTISNIIIQTKEDTKLPVITLRK
jgi:hypothetical protein